MLRFQSDVAAWAVSCFGVKIARGRVERNHRFLEEALELVQSLGCSRKDALDLVDYVYSRPAGVPQQEVGSVILTLAVLCSANRIDLEVAADRELSRVWANIGKLRQKQKAKPKTGPRPE